MKFDDLTIGEAKELARMFGGTVPAATSHPYIIGQNYIIRTVTMIDVGRLVEVHQNELVLEDAAWIADTERWADALAKGTLREVEPFPDGRVIVGRGGLIDACQWKHDLPRVQK
jgi:hypothetical protein